MSSFVTFLRSALRCQALLLACYGVCAWAAAPLETKLDPATLDAFQAYAHTAEANFLATPAIRADSSALAQLKSGRVLAESAHDHPVEIHDGLVHDWTGTVFFPHASLQQVLQVLQDFDHHSRIYPEMTESRLLHRTGNHISGMWRFERRNGPVHVTLDLYDEADYRQLQPDRWICVAHANKVVQIENSGTSREKALPEGHGYGFLWRLYGYWTLEARDGGVLAQCRTLSLSRGVPAGLGWIVNPVIKDQPRESLLSTLRATRTAVDEQVNRSENAANVRGR